MARAKAQKSKTPSLISAKDISADYGNGEVISKISFDVKSGEAFGLMGLNGAGKTTFIKILLGLQEPSNGRITVEGAATMSQAIKNKIAYLPEKFEPPTFLSGLEFVQFCLKLYRKDVSDDEIYAAADRLALDRAALKRRVNTYSKGMRQKVGLIGTFLTDCPVMILDEPMSGLDPRARARVKDEIVACRKRGITTFISSHILADMDEICDTVSVLHEGKLMFVGKPADLKKSTKKDYLERAFLHVIEGKKTTTKKPNKKKPTAKKTVAKKTKKKSAK